MKKILNIISSPGGENSFSTRLVHAINEKLEANNPGSTVHTRDLSKKPFPHLEESHITSFFTPEEHRSEEHNRAVHHSDQAIKEILDTDIMVLGVPMYNFGIPSNLKAWVDHIVRIGVTFKYGENGPVGLLPNKKTYIAIASGGVYSEGYMKAYDFTESYLRSILGFLGITDVTVYRAEGVAIPGNSDNALQKAIDSIAV